MGSIDEDQMMKTMKMKGPVVVTGVAGYVVGSWLVMRLLQLGYTIRATIRNPNNIVKTKHLLAIPEAKERLTLWKANLDDEGSFDGVTSGSIGNEILKSTLRGVLNVMKSCKKAKTVKRVIFTTSAGTVNVEENQKPVYDESPWSDLDFIRNTKMTGWMYFVSKTLTEKAAQEFAEENNIHLISVRNILFDIWYCKHLRHQMIPQISRSHLHSLTSLPNLLYALMNNQNIEHQIPNKSLKPSLALCSEKVKRNMTM
ncbi:hypothetical protein MKX03_023280 [Papaver bracteatum]|nr:hypothetical protein MKX03_023280 [Papaver bracteatum]